MDELEAMCLREHPRLVGLLGLYCGDRDVAEDLAQEALIRLARDWRKIRKLDSPGSWLHRVAINLAHSHYRRISIERRATAKLKGPSGETPRRDIEALELLKNLPHRQKSALILHYYLDLSIAEVARVMDVPDGTAKTLIHRGTRALASDPGVAEARGHA